jgi:uncharacterized protein YegL
MKNSISLGSDESLVSRILTTQTQKNTTSTPLSTHHLFIIDCSGSMWGELSQIRTDLYNKISTLLQAQDSVSIVWFSGRNQYGTIVENFKMKSDMSLQNLRSVIEKELTPRGLTAFKEPLVEAKEIIQRINKTDSDMVHSLFFLTDGHDNNYSDSEIIASVNDVKDYLVSATIVEYGYYCNKRLLNLMSTEIGGVHVFSEDFQDYSPYMAKQFNQSVMSKRQYVSIDDDVTQNVVFTIEDGNVISYNVNDDNEIFIDPEVNSPVYYLTNSSQNSSIDMDFENPSNETEEELRRGMYAAMYTFSKRSDFITISTILRTLGDAYFIKKKANTFGTQKINELEREFIDTMSYPTLMFREGYDPNAEPSEDAFCVMDLLDLLMSDDESKWYPMHPEFQYKRIGRKSVKSGRKVTEEEKDTIQALLSNNSVSEAIDKLNEIQNDEPEDIKFVNDEKAKGQPLSDLVWNNSRANLSVRVMYNGYVSLPTHDFEDLPQGRFDTKIFRNYTIIKDGVINSYKLPVNLSETTFDTLQSNGLLEGEKYEQHKIYILDFSSLPVINQKMVKQSSAKELFENQYKLLAIQAQNTVFNHFKKRYLVASTTGFKDLYGEEAAVWLKELGLADYGFNPKTTLEKSEEETFVNTMEVKIKGLSLPNTKKDFEGVLAKLETDSDLTDRETLLVPAIREFQSFIKLNDGVSDETKQQLVETWVSEKSKGFRNEKTRLMNDISKSKFLTIVGKSWFNDLESREEKKMILELDNHEREFVIEDKLSKIKI